MKKKLKKKLLLVSNLNITLRNTELNSQKKAYKRITSYCQHYYFREIAREEKKLLHLKYELYNNFLLQFREQ
jgi:hypothetical protein